MRIAAQKVVSIDYTLRDEDGNVLDSSEGGAPLDYLHGQGFLVSGLETRLEGLNVGDTLDVKLEPGEAYGERDEALTQQVPLAAFEGGQVEPGMRFQTESERGREIVTVTEVSGSHVTVDGNHPLAGAVLHFTVAVRSVRDATAEELAHGHVHGPDGHGHDHDHDDDEHEHGGGGCGGGGGGGCGCSH